MMKNRRVFTIAVLGTQKVFSDMQSLFLYICCNCDRGVYFTEWDPQNLEMMTNTATCDCKAKTGTKYMSVEAVR